MTAAAVQAERDSTVRPWLVRLIRWRGAPGGGVPADLLIAEPRDGKEIEYGDETFFPDSLGGPGAWRGGALGGAKGPRR